MSKKENNIPIAVCPECGLTSSYARVYLFCQIDGARMVVKEMTDKEAESRRDYRPQPNNFNTLTGKKNQIQ